MITTRMNNPFAIGDLVHIPQGTTLYRTIDNNNTFIYKVPLPIKIVDKPTAGLVINKSIYDFYVVSIANVEYLIKSDEINYTSEKYIHAY